MAKIEIPMVTPEDLKKQRKYEVSIARKYGIDAYFDYIEDPEEFDVSKYKIVNIRPEDDKKEIAKYIRSKEINNERMMIL